MQITLHGREDECRSARRLLDDAGGGALLFHGEPGSGRSAMLGYARQHAGARAVLAGAGLADEATLPYAGLQRLLDPVLDRVGSLPDRQRRVLRRALAGDGCPDAQRLTLATAVLALLAAAARDRPLLCTMDDVDAGDPGTAETLAVVARRLCRLPVALLLAAGGAAARDLPAHRLRPLDERQCRALLADLRPAPPPAAVAAEL
ncbi:ATP-binding protein, partial [Micromonospora sp. I033]